MNGVNRIITLISLAGMLTVGLFGFTLMSKDKFSDHEARIEARDYWVCGTSYMNNDSAIEANPKALAGRDLFFKNCKTCHELRKKKVGPAFTGVYDRRDSLWITKMIVNGNQLIRRKDKTAIKLYKEYQVDHTDFTSLKKEEVDALMHFLIANR